MRKPSFSLFPSLLAQHCAIPQKVCTSRALCVICDRKRYLQTDQWYLRLSPVRWGREPSSGQCNVGENSLYYTRRGEIVVLLNQVKAKGTSTEQILHGIFLCDAVPIVAPQSAGSENYEEQKSRTHHLTPLH